jgi:hypothetical protein
MTVVFAPQPARLTEASEPEQNRGLFIRPERFVSERKAQGLFTSNGMTAIPFFK